MKDSHQIIDSLCDTDFYKITMMNAIFNGRYNNVKYTDVWVKYKFVWRNFDECKEKLSCSLDSLKSQLDEQLDSLCTLKFSQKEIDFLSNIPFIGKHKGFVEYLRLFQLNRNYVNTFVESGELNIDIEGPWLNTILFESPVLAIVSELYSNNCLDNWSVHIAMNKLVDKVKSIELVGKNFKYIDFGTRRRFSKEWHKFLVSYQLERLKDNFVGTSNVLFSITNNIIPKGTMAHEWFQAHQQIGPKLIDSQSSALQAWAEVYRGDLGIALSDTLTTDIFLKDFDRYFSMLFDGVRQDSGDPIEFGNKLIDHYESLNVDPLSKLMVCSDNLTIFDAIRVYKNFKNRIKTSFGIGTYLTNDCGIEPPPNVVIKMVECNNSPVAKISDDASKKKICIDPSFLAYLKNVMDQKLASKE